MPKSYAMSPTTLTRPVALAAAPHPTAYAFGWIIPSRWYGASQRLRTPLMASLALVATSLTKAALKPAASARSRGA